LHSNRKRTVQVIKLAKKCGSEIAYPPPLLRNEQTMLIDTVFKIQVVNCASNRVPCPQISKVVVLIIDIELIL